MAEELKPTMQPAPTASPFGSDEVLWWNNGVWGEAGYAMPNPSGKVWSANTVISGLVSLFGRELFNLMHRPDVRFTRPPNKQFLYDIHQLVVVGRKRLNDRAVNFSDRRMDAQHASPANKTFLVYPVPFFGERIRNADAREYCELMLLTISEMMQHSDNDFDLEISSSFAAMVGERLQRILVLIATKYFGITRTVASAPEFVLPDTAFTTYDPSKLFVTSELVEERPPLQWWPTENDLSPLRGIAITEALVYGQRWPQTQLLMGGDGGSTSVTPGNGGTPTVGFQTIPGAAP